MILTVNQALKELNDTDELLNRYFYAILQGDVPYNEGLCLLQAEYEQQKKWLKTYYKKTDMPLDVIECVLSLQRKRVSIIKQLKKQKRVLCKKRILEKPQTQVTEHPNKTTLKADYPRFSKDLPVLLEKAFIQETETGYKWLKKKNALAFYFKNMNPTRERDWRIIERAFSERDLKNSSKTEYEKLPRDYEELLKILPYEV